MSLQFTHVPSFACRGGLRKWRADCSTVGLYCVTITWQQIFKVHFVLRWQAFCCMRLLNADILASNAARQWHADSGKPRTCILCKKKHEWVYIAMFHKFEKSIIRGVWPMCLSVKLHLWIRLCKARLCKARIRLCKACGNMS